MIYLLDSDMNGTDSYDFLVQAGLVAHVPCPTYEHFDNAVMQLLSHGDPATDIVILDTISQMALATRGDAKLGTDQDADLWSKRGLFLDGDKNYLTVYEMAGQLILRRLRNLRAAGFRLIVTAHEADQVDQAVKKRAPDINRALYGGLKSASSDMFRMWYLPSAVTKPDGTVYAAGTRLVSVKNTEMAVAKNHVDLFTSESLPITIPIEGPMVPVLPKIYSYLNKLPSFLLLYGEQGVGKTTAAVSEAFELYLKTKHPDIYKASTALYNPNSQQTYAVANSNPMADLNDAMKTLLT